MRRHWFRSTFLAISVAVLLGGGSLARAAPASAAPGQAGAIAASPPCRSGAALGSTVNPLTDTSSCARGPTNVEQRYEAAIAGAGLLAFVGATLIYRRRHPRGPRGLGPRAPQG